MQNGLPLLPTENASNPHDPHDPFDPLDPLDSLDRTTVQQNSIVEDQNSIIKSIRADLVEIK